MKSKVVFAVLMAALCSAYGATVRTATEGYVTNRIAAAIAAIPAPDYSPTNAELRATIEAVAPAPGDYETVSNRAMKAVQTTDADWLDVVARTSKITSDTFGVSYYFKGTADYAYSLMSEDNSHELFFLDGRWTAFDWAGLRYRPLAYLSEVAAAANAATNYTDEAIASIQFPETDLTDYATHDDVTNVADFVTSAAISTNNAAFVEAVLAAPLAGASSGDLTEIGEYGTYGTVGAAIIALIAGLAALKRRMGAAETAIAGKTDKYPFAAAVVESGTLALQDAKVQTWTPGSGATVAIAAPTGTSATVRDMELVIDCSSLAEGDEPTVTWPSNFHPHTDADDFACEAGVRNVYYISEYAPGAFAVGGWQETAGGNT